MGYVPRSTGNGVRCPRFSVLRNSGDVRSRQLNQYGERESVRQSERLRWHSWHSRRSCALMALTQCPRQATLCQIKLTEIVELGECYAYAKDLRRE
jgi:hypothetical protein